MQNNRLTEILRIGAVGLALTLETLTGSGCSYIGRNRQETTVEAKLLALNRIYERIDLVPDYPDKYKKQLKRGYRDYLTGKEFGPEEREFIRVFDKYMTQEQLKIIHPYVDLNHITDIDKVVVMKLDERIRKDFYIPESEKRRIQRVIEETDLSTLTEDERRYLKENSCEYLKQENGFTKLIRSYGMDPHNLSDQEKIFWYRFGISIAPWMNQ